MIVFQQTAELFTIGDSQNVLSVHYLLLCYIKSTRFVGGLMMLESNAVHEHSLERSHDK